MNETIYDLIDAIKEDKRYLQFKEQSLKLLNQETKELLDNYQNLLQELDDLKKFEKYIDLTQKRQELNEVRKRMSQNENIQKYYQSYYKINELLDEVTKIVFKDISDSLDENGHRHLLLHGHAGSDVQRETGLAHTGAGSEDDEVAAAKAGEDGVQQPEAGGDALILVGVGAADLLQICQRLHHAGRKGRQGAGIAAGADLIDALLGVFQQQVGVGLVARVLQNILCDTHQLAHQILFLHDLRIRLDVGDAGDRLGEAGQVDFRLVGAGEHAVRDDGVQQGDEVDGLVAGKEAEHLGVDLSVLPGVEHLGPDDLDEVGQGLGFQQHRAQHALLCLHIVGQVDAHALEVEFVIMSFVRHGRYPSALFI